MLMEFHLLACYFNLTYKIMASRTAFQVLGGSYTGPNGIVFKKGDVFTCSESLDILFPNKFIRMVVGDNVGLPTADVVSGHVSAFVQPPQAPLEPPVQPPARGNAVQNQQVAPSPVHAEPAMPPTNVTTDGVVPPNATNMTDQFVSRELSEAYDIQVWRLPTGSFAVSKQGDRKFLAPTAFESRAGVIEFIEQLVATA
jgi:hypothetical protein